MIHPRVPTRTPTNNVQRKHGLPERGLQVLSALPNGTTRSCLQAPINALFLKDANVLHTLRLDRAVRLS